MMERGDQSRSARGVGSTRASQPAGGSDSQAEIRRGDVFPAGTPAAPIVVADPLARASADTGEPRERGSDRRTERPTAWAVAAEARLATDAGDRPAPPLPADSRTDFQRRWEKIQRQFVGEAARSARGTQRLVTNGHLNRHGGGQERVACAKDGPSYLSPVERVPR